MVQVGRRIYALINRINESNNELILSEREAWVSFFVAFYFTFCFVLFVILVLVNF
jgi:hypothetical protein